jgi:hypothetical protein
MHRYRRVVGSLSVCVATSSHQQDNQRPTELPYDGVIADFEDISLL